MLLISGNSNRTLSDSIAKYLKQPLMKATVDTFSDGEARVQIEEDVRGEDVFVIQPTSPPTNQNLVELLVMIDALKRASAGRITAVMPYFGYARQDRKDQPRVPITAKLVANLITAARADRVLTVDLHAHQIQGFFDIPLDHLYAAKVFVDHIKSQNFKDIVIVSPDVGGVKMARGYAGRLKTDMAVVDKRRINDQETEVMNILGDVKGKTAIIVDDIVATAGSLVEAAAALKEQGATAVYATITHPVLSGPAFERISKSSLEKLWVTDTIAIPEEKQQAKIEVISIGPLVGEAIRRIHTSESVSGLFAE